MNTPIVSIILPVFNGEQYLKESINSILNQSYDDFELIIINDGSEDGSQKIIESYSDPRIRVLHQSNMGLPAALNNGLGLSRGKYIARQDADDISLSMRLEKQVNFLEQNPRCGLVGSAAEIWVEKCPSGRYHDHPLCSGALEFELIFNNPFVHSSWMFRRDIIPLVGRYCTDISRQPPEDYEYISRIASHYHLANLQERLVIYREVKNSLSSQIRPENLQKNNNFSQRLALISAENLARALNEGSISHEIQNFGFLWHDCYDSINSMPNFKLTKKLLCSAAKNIAKKYSDEDLLTPLSNKICEVHRRICIFKYEREIKKAPSLLPYFNLKYKLSIFVYSKILGKLNLLD